MEVLVTLEVLLFTTVVGPTYMTARGTDDSLVLLSIANGDIGNTLVLLSTVDGGIDDVESFVVEVIILHEFNIIFF